MAETNVAGFIDDINELPKLLRELSSKRIFENFSLSKNQLLYLVGLGSSYFAAQDAARYLRSVGYLAFAEIASAETPSSFPENTVVIAISASGNSVEVLKFVEKIPSHVKTIALTREQNSKLAKVVDEVVLLPIKEETGGVSIWSYRATSIALFQIIENLGLYSSVSESVLNAAKEIKTLLDSKNQWLESFMNLTKSSNGIYLMSPAERYGSALQGALMFREGPRFPADGCETGDWSHVDVYLTKTLDYKALIFSGSNWDQQAVDWLNNRKSSFGSIGNYQQGNIASIEIESDDVLTQILTELLVPELMAAKLWEAK
jgi:fructoselysine-6-P-deglycase FrlB-like protein